MPTNLVSRLVWKTLKPFTKGFVLYMEAEIPGSPLKGVRCPYAPGTESYREFQQGEQAAMLEAQDSDD